MRLLAFILLASPFFAFGQTGGTMRTSGVEINGTFKTGDTSNVYKILGAVAAPTATISATTSYQTMKSFAVLESQHTTVTDSSIVIPANGKGYYAIEFEASFTSSANGVIVEGAIFENNVENTHNLEFQQGTGGGGVAAQMRSISLSSMCHYLAGGTKITIKVKIDAGTSTLIFYKPHFSLYRLP